MTDQNPAAPRITLADVESRIAAEAYFTAHEGVLGAHRMHNDVYQLVRHDDTVIEETMKLLTFCVLVLKNGFKVTGESVCVSQANYNEELGRKLARQNAVDKIWPLLGYELSSKLHEQKRAREIPIRHRCAETGEYVTEGYAKANPATTVKETG